MKIIKKLLTAVLSLLLITGLMPLSAAAENSGILSDSSSEAENSPENGGRITSIEATLREPELSETPDQAPLYSSSPVNGITLRNIIWYRLEKEKYTGTAADEWDAMTEGEKFQTGFYYRADLYFDADENFTFAGEMTGTINGRAHDSRYGNVSDTDYAYLCIIFEPLSENTGKIRDITATLTSPALGMTPDMKPAWSSDPSDSVSLRQVIWHRLEEAKYTGTSADEWDLMAENETFAEGFYYWAELYFDAAEGFVFAETMTGEINGRVHDNRYGDVGNKDYACLSIFFEPLTEDHRTEITDIRAEITSPVLGEKPDYQPTYTTTPADTAALRTVSWYRLSEASYTGSSDDPWEMMPEGSVFEKGYYYAAMLNFGASEGCVFTENMTGSINGKPHSSLYGGIYQGDFASLRIEFEPLVAEGGGQTTTPAVKTGDENRPWIFLAAAAAIACANVVMIRRRKRK